MCPKFFCKKFFFFVYKTCLVFYKFFGIILATVLFVALINCVWFHFFTQLCLSTCTFKRWQPVFKSFLKNAFDRAKLLIPYAFEIAFSVWWKAPCKLSKRLLFKKKSFLPRVFDAKPFENLFFLVFSLYAPLSKRTLFTLVFNTRKIYI